MISRKYNLINNVGGWLVFAIALVTYWLTLEPTASYWDCGEFIIQADKLEVGHPPGNPIFMLTARFFANFASDAGSISLMVNAMSGLLSALTILLLFWTISHLVRRLVVKDGQRTEPTLQQYVAIMGSALVGSLAYCWSDTFWFSAVEGEVYAFSSFCTALVFWLILKWENRADEPHSDRYLILIAYIIGVSVAVHLLNLLCIPAIVLVFAYRKWKDMNLVKSLIALGVSFVIVALVLYGLVPGFIKVAQWMELFFVNGLGMSFNSGAIFYAFLTAAILAWGIYELYAQRSTRWISVSFVLAIAVSGMLFVGSGWVIGVILLAALAAWLWYVARKRGLPVRVMNVVLWSVAVIFVGYSSYALILIRSSADTPMNQNSPDNVFDLASYLNREQYGENPLIYGETLYSAPQKEQSGYRADTLGVYEGVAYTVNSPIYVGQVVNPGKPLYVKGVKGAVPSSEYNFLTASDQASNAKAAQKGGDYYVKRDYKAEVKMNPELNMVFPRIYSRLHAPHYGEWVNLDTVPGQLKTVNAVDIETGEKMPELDTSGGEPQFNEITGTFFWPEKQVYKPTFAQNLAYFFNYQLNHMYLRYFMWNFAGRQNDVLNQHGELDAGNWISGIPALDNARLGDQSLLPDDLGKNNAGNNKYYLLPLILGIVGLLWQSFAGKRGIEQFWVVFFLFFMTGIAIVLYLNQTPNQPRERDYAFAGSFYAYAIWIGMGVAGLWRCLLFLFGRAKASQGKDVEGNAQQIAQAREQLEEPLQAPSMTEEPHDLSAPSRYCAIVAAIIGLAVPVQMVSQTWDDHDRSGRYAARDFAINYLNSLEPNAIVFCNGDNDTFPLWYAQEVEGVRPDVRIINLSYLNSDWYANQQRMQAYEGAPVKFTATAADYAYGRNDVTLLDSRQRTPADLLTSLKLLYSDKSKDPYGTGYRMLPSSIVSIPVDKKAVVERGLVAPKDTADIVDEIMIDLAGTTAFRQKGYLSLGEILMLDIIATNAAEGWPRPIYWASTVGDEYQVGLTDYTRAVGMVNQLVPTMQSDKAPRTDRGPKVVKAYRWGGADTPGKAPYFDETARRMLYSTRTSMLDVSSQLLFEADQIREQNPAEAKKMYQEALEIARLMMRKLPAKVSPFELSTGLTLGEILCQAGQYMGDKQAQKEGLEVFRQLLKRDAQYLRYYNHIANTYVNPSLSYESAYITYQYWRIVKLFTQYGGQMKEVDDILRPTGVDPATLKALYERYVEGVGGAPASDSEEIDPAKVAEDLGAICEVANRLSHMSPEEYAAASDDDRYYDSILWAVIEMYRGEGGTLDHLEAQPAWKQLDTLRSKRLYEEYMRRHPEQAE